MVVWAPTGLDGGPFKSGHTRCITKAHHFNTEAPLFTLNVPGRSNCLQVHQPAAPCRPCWLWAFEKLPPGVDTCVLLHITMPSTDWGKRESCTQSVWIFPCCSCGAANLISAFYLRLLAGYPSCPDQSPHPPSIFSMGLKSSGNRSSSYLLTSPTHLRLSIWASVAGQTS